MGADHILNFVVGAKVEIANTKEVKYIPLYDERTGERKPDKEINVWKSKIGNIEVFSDKIERYCILEKAEIPELGELTLFPQEQIIGISIKEDSGRVYNSLAAEIPAFYPDIYNKVKKELQRLGIAAEIKTYAVVSVSS